MESNTNKTKLKSTVLDRIQKEKICPRSRWFFGCYEFFLWALWIFSILVGSLAIAVSLFAITYQRYAFYEATHGSFLVFIVETLPYIWLVTFVVMVILAIFNLRQTKGGYRYPFWKVLISSLVFSFVGGGLLHVVGMGFMVDKKLGEHLHMYQSQEKMEQKMWQRPNEGRLVGFVVKMSNESNQNSINFKDIRGIEWETNIQNLFEDDLIVLRSGKKMKILGQVISTEPHRFHACGVFPWMFEKNMSMKELSAERRAVIDRIYQHKDHGSSSELKNIIDRCAELKVMKRLEMM